MQLQREDDSFRVIDSPVTLVFRNSVAAADGMSAVTAKLGVTLPSFEISTSIVKDIT